MTVHNRFMNSCCHFDWNQIYLPAGRITWLRNLKICERHDNRTWATPANRAALWYCWFTYLSHVLQYSWIWWPSRTEVPNRILQEYCTKCYCWYLLQEMVFKVYWNKLLFHLRYKKKPWKTKYSLLLWRFIYDSFVSWNLDIILVLVHRLLETDEFDL